MCQVLVFTPAGEQWWINSFTERELLKMTVGCFIEELVKIISTLCAFSEYSKEDIGLSIGGKPLDDKSAPLSKYKITSGTAVQMTSNKRREREREREGERERESLCSRHPESAVARLTTAADVLWLHRVRNTYDALISGSAAQRDGFKQEKCYNPQDPTLTLVDRDDDLDFLCEGFKSPRALMSCGHAVTPTSLTNWCLRLLEQGESKFVCGQPECDKKWSYVEVRKMALLTPEEMEHFEKTMAINASRHYFDCRLCPGCSSSVVRKDESDLSVVCCLCTRNKGRNYEFCWQCLREWKGPRPRSDRCDNDGCCNEA